MGLLDLNNYLVNFNAPPAPIIPVASEPGHAMVVKSVDNTKEAIAQNPVMMAYQRMSMEAGLRRPQGITFATLRRMSRVNWVDRTCIKTLTDEVTAFPWDIVPVDAKKTYNPNLQKFLVLLLTHPNQNKESWRMLIDKVVEDILVCDAGVIEKVRDLKGRVAELYYVDGTTIKPCYDIKGMLGDPAAYEQYLPTPTNQVAVASWNKWDLIRMQWNPSGAIDNYGWGMSPVESGLAVATAFLNAEAYNMAFFQRNTVPPVVINLGEDVPPDEVTAFRAYLAAEMAGQSGFWQPFAMSGGKGFDIKQLLKAPADMAWKEYVEWQMKWKVALYRMSPQDIGFNLDQYKMEGDVQLQLSKNKAINSIKDMIQGYINTEIINDPGWGISPLDINLKFQWIDSDTVDPLDQAQIDKIYWSMGVIENNYIRKERFGLDPIVGGKVPFVIQGATAFALNPKLIDEAGGALQAIDESAGSDNDEEDEEMDDVSKILPAPKEEIKKDFSPQEGLIADLSLNATAIAWMDDRGVTQPLFVTDFSKSFGFTIKPSFLDDKRGQDLFEGKVSQIVRKLHGNTPDVKIMSYDEVAQILPLHLHAMLTKYINVEAPYDSQEWRQRWGDTRMSDQFIVTGFITGQDLNNKSLQASMKASPDLYKKAIEDFARIWLIEKRFFLGDRKPGHYIITKEGNGFGVDYQFFNTKHSWEKTSVYLPETLKELNPELYNYWVQCLVKEYHGLDSVEKAFRATPKEWTAYPEPAELEKKMGVIAQKNINNWYAKAIHVKKNGTLSRLKKSQAFNPDDDYIVDGEYVWQNEIKYPLSVLDSYVNSWFDPNAPQVKSFATTMQKYGLSNAQIAYASLLLLSMNDYAPFARLGQTEALAHLKQQIPVGDVITKPVWDLPIYQDRINFLAKTLSQTIKDSIDSVLKQSIANKDTIGTIQDKIYQTLGINPNNPRAVGWRAERIARTEGMWGLRESAIQQYEAQGIKLVNLITLANACAECMTLAQDNPYTLDDARGVGMGGLHPNCYCRWEIEIQPFDQ